MPETFNIYCDESRHLEHDHQGVMVLEAVWTPLLRVADLAKASRSLKHQFGWTTRLRTEMGEGLPGGSGLL